jgi:hypothetical protein
MGIIVKEKKYDGSDGRIVFYLKGAEVVMRNKVRFN